MDLFRRGVITWLTGNNIGRSMEVKDNASGGVITLLLPMPDVIDVGDTYSLVTGCLKDIPACKVFDNVENHQGFPDLPGNDALFTIEG